MKFSAVAALLAFAASASAQGISVIQPILGAVWQTGQTNTITWSPINATTITSIVLRAGQSTNLDTVATISSAQLDATVGKYDWVIDNSIPTGAAYSIQVSTEQGQAYSPYFTIVNGGGASAPAGSNTAAASGAAASGAAASGSGAKPSGSASGSAPAASTTDSGASSVKASAVLGLAAGAAAIALF